jgi:ATP-binding cassette subfamily F protein uup
MSSIIQLKNIQLAYGAAPLLDGVDLTISQGERVCLVGRNGSGKSTLMKVISGDIQPDDGQRIVESNIVVARLEQDPPERNDISIFNYVAEGLKEAGELIKAYSLALDTVSEDPSEANLLNLQAIQDKLDAVNGWQFEQRINKTLSILGLDGKAQLSSLSGGWRRKAALARAWVQSPDILLLDEPTNHLDIAMINWLEESLKQFTGAIVFISHDRAFIRAMSTRIIDLDRGILKSYPGNYEQYLEKKAQDQAVLETQQAEFDKKLAQEEVWIRQGIKARRTRNEGRVRALEALRVERKKRRELQGSVLATQSKASRSGKRVFDVAELTVKRGEKLIADCLNMQILRKDKIAFIGPNGCGKSSLIKAFLGEIAPESGEVQTGANIEVAYFDQHRSQLDLDKTVIDTVGDGKRDLVVNGNPRHVISYLQDYLFEPDRVNAPVRSLSGGEKNRLLLAKLMLKPSNVLILDEPTNDLDVDTLEMLETLLIGYEGTVLLVSHDREFVDNVASSCLAYENNGIWKEFVGGYSDMLEWYAHNVPKGTQQARKGHSSESGKSTVEPLDKTSGKTKAPKKLSYKDSRELEALPDTIDKLESEIEQLQSQINQTDFFTKPNAKDVLDALSNAENALSEAYARWDELESMQKSVQQ